MMTLTSCFMHACVVTSLCGTTVRSAGAVSLALRPAESANIGGIATKVDNIDKESGSAQLIIADTVRDVAEEYGHQGDRSRGDVSARTYITSVAWLAMLVMFLFFCPTSCYLAEQVRARAGPRAREAGAARPTPRPPSSSSSSNDRLTRCRRAPEPEPARPTLHCALTVPARSTLHCSLQGAASRQGRGEAVLVRSCADGTPLFRARVEGGGSAVIFLETVWGDQQFGCLSTSESGGPEPEMEIMRACGARFGSMRKDGKGGYMIASRTGAPVLSFGHPAHDLHAHGSGDNDLHPGASRNARPCLAHDLHVHDSTGATMAEVKPGSNKGTYEVQVNSNGDVGLVILGALAILREEQIVSALAERAH